MSEVANVTSDNLSHLFSRLQTTESPSLKPSVVFQTGMSGTDFLRLFSATGLPPEQNQPETAVTLAEEETPAAAEEEIPVEVFEEDFETDSQQQDEELEDNEGSIKTKLFLHQVHALVSEVLRRIEFPIVITNWSTASSDESPGIAKVILDSYRHLVDILCLRVWADAMRSCKADASKLSLTPEARRKVQQFVQIYLAQFPSGYSRELCDAQIS